jgi:hypothetical protein
MLDGNNKFSARLQSFITGQQVGKIAIAEKLGKNPSMSSFVLKPLCPPHLICVLLCWKIACAKLVRSEMTQAMTKFAGKPLGSSNLFSYW